jgi:hypothetical protein
MVFRLALMCAAASACGQVAATPTDAGGDAAATPTTFRGMTDTQPVTFGGKAAVGTATYCMYKITLKQLAVELAILPSGAVASGRVQDLNVEEVIPSTTPVVCDSTTGTIPPNIATYTLASTTPAAGGGVSLTFRGGATNQPNATLTGTVLPAGDGYLVTLSVHRTDASDAVLNWTVASMLPLAR